MDIDDSVISLKVKFAGICGSDINKVYSGHINENNVEKYGHEVVCERDGHLYVVNPFICMCNLEHCDMNSYLFCENNRRIGAGIADSGYSSNMRISPKMQMDLIDDWVYPETGVFVDGAAVVFHLIHMMKMKEINKVLIIGSGSIALLTALILKDIYSGIKIDIVVRSEDKMSIISEHFYNVLNVIDVDEMMKSNETYDVCFEAVGGNQTESISIAIKKTKFNGNIYVLGAFANSTKDIQGIRELFYKQIAIQGINSYCNQYPDYQHAFEWIKKNQTVVRNMITDIYVIDKDLLRSEQYRSRIIQYIKQRKIIKGIIKYE